MIELRHINKSFRAGRGRKVVARDISIRFPEGRAIGLLGRNGAGKSTLLRMIAGTMQPDSGSVVRQGSVSWPVGYAGSFHGDLTGAQNIRFLARIYGVEPAALTRFVEGFSELGPHFRAPFKTYSSGMKSRLAFGASMGIDCDTYLIDEVTAVGDAAFRQKSTEFMLDRLRNRSAIVVSHGMGMLRRICDCAVVLEDGRLTYFEDLEEAISVHEARMLSLRDTAA